MRTRLRRALTSAITTRDVVAVAALRAALAAIDNAEAVPVVGPRPRSGAGSEHVAGSGGAAGATEAPRRPVTNTEMDAIVRAQVSEWLAAATEYDRLGRPDVALRLRAEAGVLAGFAGPGPGPGPGPDDGR